MSDAIPWGISSLFVQVTVVPALTVSVCGVKLKLSMETCAEVTAGGAVSVCADPGGTAAANMIEVAKATS